jgi:hypothetical protein
VFKGKGMKQLLLLLILTTSSVFASESTITKIKRVGTTNLGDGVIIETTNTVASTCTSSVKIFMKKDVTLLFSENLSILLSAFHANSDVRLYTNGCVDSHIGFQSVSVIK